MGSNNGKFFDVRETHRLFADVMYGFTSFQTRMQTHTVAIQSYVNNQFFGGCEAQISKIYFNGYQMELVEEILQLQKEISSIEDELLFKFKKEVDSADDARIEYDALENMNNRFQSLYLDFRSNAAISKLRAKNISGKFNLYGTITIPDFTEGVSDYKDLCGGDSTHDGYIYRCIKKLISFDTSSTKIIKDAMIPNRVEDIYSRMHRSYRYSDFGRLIARERLTILPEMDISTYSEILNSEEKLLLGMKNLFPNIIDASLGLGENLISLWEELGFTRDKIYFLKRIKFPDIKEWHWGRNKHNDTPKTVDEVCDITYDAKGDPVIDPQNGWVLLDSSLAKYHMFTNGEQGEDAQYNYKFVKDNSDGSSSEVIICIPPKQTGKPAEIVTDPFNAGTYNYANPSKTPIGKLIPKIFADPKNKDNWVELGKDIGHLFKDVIPYYVAGNGPEDSGLDMLPKRILGPEAPLLSELVKNAKTTIKSEINNEVKNAKKQVKQVEDWFVDLGNDIKEDYNDFVEKIDGTGNWFVGRLLF